MRLVLQRAMRPRQVTILGSLYMFIFLLSLIWFMRFQESLFFASEVVTVLGWSRLSDHIGRKPPLVLDTLGCAAVVSCFGLSNQFWMMILCRGLQGVFNGNIGITKAMVTEITDATNMAQAFSLMPLIWGVGDSARYSSFSTFYEIPSWSWVFKPSNMIKVGAAKNKLTTVLFSMSDNEGNTKYAHLRLGKRMRCVGSV